MKKDYIPLLLSVICVALFILKYGFKSDLSVGFIIGALSVGILSTAILETQNNKAK